MFTPTLFDAALETFINTSLNIPVYPGHIPQSALSVASPQVVYQLVFERTYNTLNFAAGFVASDYQLDVWGQDKNQVEQTAESLRRTLETYRGFMGSVRVTNVRYENEEQDYEDSVSASDNGYYRIMQEITVYRQESIPTF